MPTYVYEVWVHAGGDDESYEVKIKASNQKIADERLVNWLKYKNSRVLGDWVLRDTIE